VAGPGAPAVSWQSEQLPAGFRMTARSTRLLPGARSAVTHLVFSDGLATVSVFVEQSEPGAAAPGRRGGTAHAAPSMTTLGPSVAFSTFVDGHKVIAIGEVPADTVRAIAGSLRAGEAAGGPRDGGHQ